MSLVLIAPPAQARPSKLKVTLSVPSTVAPVGTRIQFSGLVSKGGSSARAFLQHRQVSSSWATVKSTTVSKSRRVSFVVKAREGRFSYRVVVAKTERSKRSISRSGVVTGWRQSSPPASTVVTPVGLLVTGTLPSATCSESVSTAGSQPRRRSRTSGSATARRSAQQQACWSVKSADGPSPAVKAPSPLQQARSR